MWGRWMWKILDGLVDGRLLMVVIDGMGWVSGGLSIRPHDTLTLAESSTHVTLRLWGTSTRRRKHPWCKPPNSPLHSLSAPSVAYRTAADMQRCLFSTAPRSSFALAAPFKTTPAKRLIHDIVISRTGKPIIRTPRGGRCVSNFYSVFYCVIFEHGTNGGGGVV